MKSPIYIIDPADIIWDYLEETSNGKSMNVDGSSTPVVFSWSNDRSVPAIINIVHIFLLDDGIATTGWPAYQFAALGALLTNGCLLKFLDPSGSAVFTYPTITSTAELNVLCTFGSSCPSYSVADNASGTVANSNVMYYPDPVVVAPEGSITFTVQDDLTGLDELFCLVQGCYLK